MIERCDGALNSTSASDVDPADAVVTLRDDGTVGRRRHGPAHVVTDGVIGRCVRRTTARVDRKHVQLGDPLPSVERVRRRSGGVVVVVMLGEASTTAQLVPLTLEVLLPVLYAPLKQQLTVKLEFHGTDTGNNTDMDILADPREDSRAEVGVSGDFAVQLATSRTRTTILADLSADTRRAFFARMFLSDARMYTCTCTVHDKLSCARLQNYTIGASLMSVSVSVSVSVPWNSSYTTLRSVC